MFFWKAPLTAAECLQVTKYSCVVRDKVTRNIRYGEPNVDAVFCGYFSARCQLTTVAKGYLVSYKLMLLILLNKCPAYVRTKVRAAFLSVVYGVLKAALLRTAIFITARRYASAVVWCVCPNLCLSVCPSVHRDNFRKK